MASGSEASQGSELSDLFARCVISAVGKLHEELSWVAGRHPNLLRDLLEGVPAQVAFRMEVRQAGTDRCSRFPVRERWLRGQQVPQNQLTPQSQNRKVTGTIRRTGIRRDLLRVFPRQPEGHQKRVSTGIGRRKGERRGQKGRILLIGRRRRRRKKRKRRREGEKKQQVWKNLGWKAATHSTRPCSDALLATLVVGQCL